MHDRRFVLGSGIELPLRGDGVGRRARRSWNWEQTTTTFAPTHRPTDADAFPCMAPTHGSPITSPTPSPWSAEVSSQRASDISGSGEDLTLTSYLFGPRFSWHRSGHFAPFGSGPAGWGACQRKLCLEQFGICRLIQRLRPDRGRRAGYRNYRHFAIRALEADYYRTQFTNGLNDRQNNLRLSAGVIFRFGEK